MMYSKVSKILISRRSTLLLHFIQTKTSTSWRTAVVQRSLRTSHYFLFTRCRWFDQNLRCFLYYRCLSSLPFLLRLIAFIWFDFYVAFNSGCFTCVSSGWMDSLSFVAFENIKCKSTWMSEKKSPIVAGSYTKGSLLEWLPGWVAYELSCRCLLRSHTQDNASPTKQFFGLYSRTHGLSSLQHWIPCWWYCLFSFLSSSKAFLIISSPTIVSLPSSPFWHRSWSLSSNFLVQFSVVHRRDYVRRSAINERQTSVVFFELGHSFVIFYKKFIMLVLVSFCWWEE